ncbi:helix-turn-helix transcriptional regulator [Paracoccus sp. TK19116]|uniref:Helix-turn-helix transcriptional regulator n=1 Tax=Paracoccus albicereus TaxID=2922394 RepID=A0ABT1MNI6_9RHOB|nr:substrate-binding domain-containing protein [Paracoccus albicereus]MCQ0969654.1 helix-turn-helix transcriptional regulator [Paracoccus albicereus]
MQIEIVPVWRFRKSDAAPPMTVMLDFLNEIRATGKITRAAEQAGISYRHAWNLIEKWSDFFEAPLVERQRGKGTSLTPFGERLVWAGQRLQARLMPQLANLIHELEAELVEFLPKATTEIRAHASHGFAVEELQRILDRQGDMVFDLRYVSNETSLAALKRGDCDLAGMHLPQGPLRKEAVDMTRALLGDENYSVINFVTREMGLMVQRGNPLRIKSVADLKSPGLRFVARDPASGTAQLLQQILAQSDMRAEDIGGGRQTTFEFTHAAVAAYVASGMADASFGVEAAARKFGLEFLPLLTEDYVFVCRDTLLKTDAMARVTEAMQSSEFKKAVDGLPGYHADSPGISQPASSVF